MATTTQIPHLTPVRREDVPELEPVFKEFEGFMGYLPNAFLVMAQRPEIVQTFLPFLLSVMGSGRVDPGLKLMVAQMTGQTVGCPYCEAHAGELANQVGVEEQKLAALCRFEADERFTPAERAVLRLARDAAQMPNAATKAHFEELKEYYTEPEIAELVAVMASFAFLTRWNDTNHIELEDSAFEWGIRNLKARGWDASHLRKSS